MFFHVIFHVVLQKKCWKIGYVWNNRLFWLIADICGTYQGILNFKCSRNINLEWLHLLWQVGFVKHSSDDVSIQISPFLFFGTRLIWNKYFFVFFHLLRKNFIHIFWVGIFSNYTVPRVYDMSLPSQPTSLPSSFRPYRRSMEEAPSHPFSPPSLPLSSSAFPFPSPLPHLSTSSPTPPSVFARLISKIRACPTNI